MGQKINPISLRLQKTNRRYDSSWYSNYHYGELFLFDLKVRDYLERILKQLKYPEGRALISHFSKGSKINLFAFNPTSSRQQKLAPFGLKGGVHKQEGQRKLSPVLAKSFEHRNELLSTTFSIKKRPLKGLSSKSKGISIDQEVLLVNHVPTITCSEKKITASLPSDWQHNGSHLVPFFALKDTLNPSYLLKVKRLRDSCFARHASASLTFNIRAKQFKRNEELKVKLKQKTLMQAHHASKSEHKQLVGRSEGTASTQLVQAENTCFTRNTLSTPASEARNSFFPKVVSKTLSLWYQRGQTSTHPILVSLGRYKKTIPLRDKTKETSCKAVAKTCSEKKITATVPCNKLLLPRDPSCFARRATFKEEEQSFSKENSLYRCHVEGVLDQQTGSSVKLVPFQVSTEKQSALFLAQEVVYFLEKRVSFRKIKDQILKELKNSKIIKGVRITCSGRVGGKSKKAQKGKTETVKQGQTSLGVFSSKIDFAQKSGLTSFGLIGVKVWICFY